MRNGIDAANIKVRNQSLPMISIPPLVAIVTSAISAADPVAARYHLRLEDRPMDVWMDLFCIKFYLGGITSVEELSGDHLTLF